MSETETRIKVDVNEQLKEPSLFKIIYVNDNETSMEFVIESLVEIFDYAPTTAESLTIKVHEEGAATVAILPYEMAEQKGIEVTVSARSAGYPLQVKLEPEL
jgi:ATP-dependent Clp protease adaptor protein ClpS